jgi:hypothetical protein
VILPDRTFRSDWILDVRLRKLPPQVQLLLVFLRPLCDVVGRFEMNARNIHSALYRSAECGNVSVRDVEAWLEMLRSGGYIKAYSGSDGRRIGEVSQAYWRQRLNYGTAKYEAEPPDPELPLVAGAPPPHPQKRSEVKRTSDVRPADAVRDEAFLALAGVDGSKIEGMTRSALRAVAVKLAEIRAVEPEVTAAIIEAKAVAYRRKFPTAVITASALAKHWGSLGLVVVSANPWEREPDDWRAYWRETYPPEDYPAASRWEEHQWHELPSPTQRDIYFELKNWRLRRAQ